MKLKPCPFCGNIPEFKNIYENFGGYSIQGFIITCQCGIKTENKIYGYDGKTEEDLKNKLTEIWNRRV